MGDIISVTPLLTCLHHTGTFSYCPLLMMAGKKYYFHLTFLKGFCEATHCPEVCFEILWYNLLFLMCPYVVLVHSATERRSRLLFMRQWSQMGHSKKRKISQEELVKWAESLNTLLASQSEFYLIKTFLKAEIVLLTNLHNSEQTDVSGNSEVWNQDNLEG